MKKLVAVLYILLSLCTAPSFADEYHFDKEHTTILFFINHLGFSDKIGRFIDYDGHLNFDEEYPEKSEIHVTIRPSGIRTDSEKLDKELQKKDWFNSEVYPEITFHSTQIKLNRGKKAEVSGWMNMLGKEQFVTLHTTFNKSGEHPITKNHIAGFSADTTINRSHFGMNNSVPLVGENVRMHIEAEFIRDEDDPEFSLK
ncbi:YceI family protein [Rickettsiales bacterium]|nr:YceI family protein [Rickettsiales bacterium]